MAASALSEATLEALASPDHLYTGAEVVASPSPVPPGPGVYGWFFRTVPPGFDVSGCVRHQGCTLLYVGISPKAPPARGRPSSQNLRTRIRYHYRGNAEGSTLRLTLGCLLAPDTGLELRRVGSGTRLTFSAGETLLTEWMRENALVCWHECQEPWHVESALLGRLDLPLNLDQNRHHAFHSSLTAQRRQARERARLLPILPR